MSDFKPFRSDAVDKVTGAAMYSADFTMPGMLHAKVLWPPVPSARIIKIDTSRAQEAPGIVRVFTRKDITGSNAGGMFAILDRPVLVGEGEQVRFTSDAIALVAARTEDQAARALELIDVEYEELPAAHTMQQAIEMGLEPVAERSYSAGDVQEGFARADVIVEQEFFNPYQEHAHIEPEAGIAYVDNDGMVNICVGSQHPVQMQRYVGETLGYPQHKVRVYSPYVGGGFGSKHSVSVHVFLALIAHELRRPVRMVWTREESICQSCKKQSLSAKVKLGLEKDGKICALQARVTGPAGPYLGNGGDSLGAFQAALCGAYRQTNIDLFGALYPTTGLELGALRGVGWPDGIATIEAMLTRGAAQLGIDQLTVRQRNWLMTSEDVANQVNGLPTRNVSDVWSMPEMMDKALEAAGELPAAKPGTKVGRGIANAAPAFCIGNSTLHKGSVAELVMFLDGTLLVKLGFTEIGQGLTEVAKKFATNAMELSDEQVNVILGDTHKTPIAGALAFSQTTVTGGNAIYDAAGKLKEKMAAIARECLGSEDESIRYSKGGFYDASGAKVLDWKTFSDYCYLHVKDLTATGCIVGPLEDLNVFGVTPVCGVVDVEVNEETGEIKVLQVVHSHDTGKVIHHESARGQILGSAVMSLGAMLIEEFNMEEGRAVTPSFAEYLIPTAMDTPEVNKAIMWEGNPGHGCPEGAKGIGEHGMYVAGGALVNAIFDAVGVSITHLPITSEKLLKAMSKF